VVELYCYVTMGGYPIRRHPLPSYLIFLDTETKSAHLAVSIALDVKVI
jgi:hypothetical protein